MKTLLLEALGKLLEHNNRNIITFKNLLTFKIEQNYSLKQCGIVLSTPLVGKFSDMSLLA